MDAPVQHCSDSACPDHPPESQGTRPGIVGDVLGVDSVMGERRLRRDEDDQREGGNGRHEASVSAMR